MINGAHIVIFSTDADADRAFFRDVLGYPFVDAGHDWLIFALPPAELAVHPAEANGAHELFLMCDDVEQFVAPLASAGCTASSAGGSAKMSQSCPASTKGYPSTSRKKARSASASVLKMTMCAPLIMVGLRIAERR